MRTCSWQLILNLLWKIFRLSQHHLNLIQCCHIYLLLLQTCPKYLIRGQRSVFIFCPLIRNNSLYVVSNYRKAPIFMIKLWGAFSYLVFFEYNYHVKINLLPMFFFLLKHLQNGLKPSMKWFNSVHLYLPTKQCNKFAKLLF